MAASLHWLATCRDAFLFEDCVDDSPLRHQLTQERVQAQDGWISVPDRPGLGVTLDEDFVNAHLISESGRETAGLNGQRSPSTWHLLPETRHVTFGNSTIRPPVTLCF